MPESRLIIEAYNMGYRDGINATKGKKRNDYDPIDLYLNRPTKKTVKRKLSDWQKFVKANSNKKKFKYANGKLKLKTMGIAYRKTAAYKRNKKK